jgi:Domain of unknown function (DUF5655)
MTPETERDQLWTCYKCGKQYKLLQQSHTCIPSTLEHHFEGKPAGKALYRLLVQAVKKQVGPFTVESPESCIFFVNGFTFTRVQILNNAIRVNLVLSREIEMGRYKQVVKISEDHYLYYFDITAAEDIDDELMKWIQEAYQKQDKYLPVL